MPLPSTYTGAFRVNAKSNNRLIPTSSLIHYSYNAPPAAVANGISVAHLGAAAAGARDMVIGGSLAAAGVATLGYNNLDANTQLASPPVPRNVVITVTHASAVVAMSGVISGIGMDGRPQTEPWAVTAGTVSKTYTGVKAFSTVTGITEVIAADASANTIIAGSGNVLGIPVKTAIAKALLEIVDAAIVATGVVVAAGTAAQVVAGTADALGTYTPATAPNGAHNYEILVVSDAPGDS